MTVEEATPPAAPPIEIFPDNWIAVCVFCALGTQWRVGFGGPYGLDYNVLLHKLDRLGLTTEEYDSAEADVRVLEGEALAEMREQQEREEKKKGNRK